VLSRSSQLYNLDDDPQEKRNLADVRTKKVEEFAAFA